MMVAGFPLKSTSNRKRKETEVNFVDDKTGISYSKKSFVYDFLSSMRQKVNDPLGVRAKKRKKINQQ